MFLSSSNDPNFLTVPGDVNNEGELESLRLADCGLSELAACTCVFESNARIEENERCSLETYSVLPNVWLPDVRGSFPGIPHEAEPVSGEMNFQAQTRI